MPPIRRASLLSLYETAVSNEQRAFPSSYDDEEMDDPYDVYLFWPSRTPHVLIPEDLAEDMLSEASSSTVLSHQHEHDDVLSPVATPFDQGGTENHHTHEVDHPSILADPAEVNHDASENDAPSTLGLAGYSKLFTAGLAQTSRQVTQQLDGAIQSFRRAFTWSRWFGRQP